nr:acyltransferase family protein [Helcobacillus sp. ACRRO]
MSDKPVFRRDIHGLRGLAVLLVVLYHVFVGRVSGGVDVFLFVSAFFLTGTFLRRWERGQPTAPLAYWARTFKRLLPPAAAVIAVFLLLTWLVAGPQTVLAELPHAMASLAQVENWFLIGQSVDYYAASRERAPLLQHFWSLSIQAQVFILLPALFALISHLTRRIPAHRRTRARFSLTTIALLLLFAASLLWSALSTASQQEIAYFDTTARLWEFCLGALVAVALHHRGGRGLAVFAQRPALSAAVSYTSVAALVAMGAVVDVAGLFPGLIALWPLTAAALVMTTGHNRLLASRPFQFLGDISYGLYLIHWPLLIVMLASRAQTRLPLTAGMLVVAVSLIAAWLLTRFVDSPIRHWEWAGARPIRGAAVTAAALLIGFGATTAVERGAASQVAAQEALAFANNPGAQTLKPGYEPHPQRDPSAPELPGPAARPDRWFELPDECTDGFRIDLDFPGLICRTRVSDRVPMDDPASRPAGEKLVLYVGNSRLQQSAAAIEPLAEAEGWNSAELIKTGCAFGNRVDAAGNFGHECAPFADRGLEYILKVRPDAVVMATTFVTLDGKEVVSPGTETIIDRLEAEGIRVIGLRDTPRLGAHAGKCRESGGSVDDCTEPLQAALQGERADRALADRKSVHLVDLTADFCPRGTCSPVLGNVTVFQDQHHVTKEIARSASWDAERQLKESGFRW